MEDKKERTIAQMLHESYWVNEHINDTIMEAFEKYEPEVYEKLDFNISSDEYDNSIEIYFKTVLPYPYEPCWEIRNIILAMGFGRIYWNFADEDGKFTEEIRGAEPRRFKNAPERSDAAWCKEFYEKWGISGTDKRFDGSWFDNYKRKT